MITLLRDFWHHFAFKALFKPADAFCLLFPSHKITTFFWHTKTFNVNYNWYFAHFYLVFRPTFRTFAT